MEVDPDELPSLESILRDLDRLDYEDAKAAGKGRSKAAGLVVVESNPQLRRSSGHTCRARVDPGPKAAATRRGKVFAGLFRDEDSYGNGDEAAAVRPSPGLQSQVKVAEMDSDETHDLKSRPAAPAAPNRLSLKLGDVARLEGLEGYRSKLNGQPCKVEGLDHESKTCFVRLLGGFLETVSLENVLPESDPIDFHNATAPRGKKKHRNVAAMASTSQRCILGKERPFSICCASAGPSLRRQQQSSKSWQKPCPFPFLPRSTWLDKVFWPLPRRHNTFGS
eukprot:symbB.v1.2.027939.t1/scaffold2905.1/size90209/3